jgi:predicted nuclease of predicted toxin-antitoxin system
MRILVDENVPNITVRDLRGIGHDVLDIRGTERQGLFDDELWALAQAERRLLISTDKGFAEYRDQCTSAC